MSIGIAISTYSSSSTDPQRYKIIDECLKSIQIHTPATIPKVIVVDDATQQHQKILDKYSDSFCIIKHRSRKGIALTKNTGLTWLLQRSVDFLVLMDDDVIIKRDEWWLPYTKSMTKHRINHMYYYPRHIYPSDFQVIDGLVKYRVGIADCFQIFTKHLIEQMGYFRKLPYEYGYEHENYIARAIHQNLLEGMYDVVDSNEYIELHPLSVKIKSMDVNWALTFRNQMLGHKDLDKYVDHRGLVTENFS